MTNQTILCLIHALLLPPRDSAIEELTNQIELIAQYQQEDHQIQMAYSRNVCSELKKELRREHPKGRQWLPDRYQLNGNSKPRQVRKAA